MEDFSQAQNSSRIEVQYDLWFAQNKMLEAQEKASHQSPLYYLYHCVNLPQLVESDTASPDSQYAKETQDAVSTYM